MIKIQIAYLFQFKIVQLILYMLLEIFKKENKFVMIIGREKRIRKEEIKNLKKIGAFMNETIIYHAILTRIKIYILIVLYYYNTHNF